MVSAPGDDDNSLEHESGGLSHNSISGGADDPDDRISVGSSDRELFRKSMHALDLLATPNRVSSKQALAGNRCHGLDDNGAVDYTMQDRVRSMTNILDDSQPYQLQYLRAQAKNGNLRATLRGNDEHKDGMGTVSNSTIWPRKRRESGMSDASGYKSSDSDLEPLTVAQLYHSKPWHMRGEEWILVGNPKLSNLHDKEPSAGHESGKRRELMFGHG